MRSHPTIAITLVGATALAFVGLAATPAYAATFTASTEAELATAITTANGNGEADTITLTGAGFRLTANLPAITETLSIVGPGSGAFTLNADGKDGFDSTGSGTNSSFSLTGIEIDNAGNFAVETDNIDVILSDLVVDSLIRHFTGDFSATDVEVDGAPSTAGFDINVGASESVVLTRVAVSATFDEGIKIYAEGTATVSVDDSTVTGSGFDGFEARMHGTSSIEVTGSVFSDNVGLGLDIESSDSATVTVSGITADSNEGAGIVVAGEHDSIVTIRNSSASDNGGDGLIIRSFDSVAVTVSGITADRNEDDGIDVDGDGDSIVTIRNSSASDNGGDGLNIQSSDSVAVTVSGITADRNERDGFDVDGNGDSIVTIRDSSASDNGDRGFELTFTGGAGTFDNLTAERNGDEGFDIEADEGSSITLTNPSALDNVDIGIIADPNTTDAVVTVNGGRAEGNGGHGLFLNVDTGTAIADGFVARGNDAGGVDIDGFGGDAILRNSWVTDNNGTGSGGIDINAYDGEDGSGPLNIVIENTTINGNTSGLGGGVEGTLSDGSTLTVRNSTISGNQADVGGGVIIDGDIDSEFTLEHSTVTLNETTGFAPSSVAGVIVDGVQTTITHTIIAGNVAPGPGDDLGLDSGTLDIDHSLVQTADAASLTSLAAGTGNIVGEAAGLGPLADNGGPTLTHLPLTGSPVISAGNASIVGVPATDQRGETRVVDVIEIGAVELAAPELAAPELAATGASESTAALAGGLALLLVLGGSLLLVSRMRRQGIGQR